MTDLRGKTIAVIGVSDRPGKYGHRIFKDLMAAGIEVVGVSPRDGEVLGRKIYKNLREAGVVPDLVVTVVPHEVTERVVEDCRALGVKEIWMQPGSESDLAVKKAGEYGIKVTHNACIMVDAGIW